MSHKRLLLASAILALLAVAGCIGTTDAPSPASDDDVGASSVESPEPTSQLPAPAGLEACKTQKALFPFPRAQAPSFPPGFEPIPFEGEPSGETIQLVTRARTCQHGDEPVREFLATVSVEPTDPYRDDEVDDYGIVMGGYTTSNALHSFYTDARLTSLQPGNVTLDVGQPAPGAERGHAEASGPGFETTVETDVAEPGGANPAETARLFAVVRGAVTGALDLETPEADVAGSGEARLDLPETGPLEITGEGLHLHQPEATLDPVEEIPRVEEDAGVSVDVPVDVVLVGFEPGTAEELQTRLDAERVQHLTSNSEREFPFEAEGEASRRPAVPLQPTARYEVHQVDAAAADGFFSAVADHEVEEGVYDANAAEDRLGELIANRTDVQLDRDTPALVLLHANGRLGTEHAWRISYPNGHLQPVRAFGERLPLVAFDVSAEPDPYVTQRASEKAEYNQRLDPGGEETLTQLAQLTENATHYRLLKGPIYPPPTRSCHDVNVLLAVHQTAITQLAPGYREAEAWVDPGKLEAAFENATGDPVQVHLQTITLPQDDPVLDALSRRAHGDMEGFVFMDATRWHLDENWETYVESREGCAEYLSLMLYGDATTMGTAGNGVALYDVRPDRRISVSVVNDFVFLDEPGPAPTVTPGNRDQVTEAFDGLNYLLAHETGHLLGLNHPQHGADTDRGQLSNPAFQSVWSPMGYQADDELSDFGALDRSQIERARTGYALRQAKAAGLADSTAYEEALDAVEAREWERAFDVLEGELDRARADRSTVLPGYHVQGAEPLPALARE